MPSPQEIIGHTKALEKGEAVLKKLREMLGERGGMFPVKMSAQDLYHGITERIARLAAKGVSAEEIARGIKVGEPESLKSLLNRLRTQSTIEQFIDVIDVAEKEAKNIERPGARSAAASRGASESAKEVASEPTEYQKLWTGMRRIAKKNPAIAQALAEWNVLHQAELAGWEAASLIRDPQRANAVALHSLSVGIEAHEKLTELYTKVGNLVGEAAKGEDEAIAIAQRWRMGRQRPEPSAVRPGAIVSGALAVIVRLPDGRVAIHTPFEAVNTVKSLSNRTWNPSLRVWIIGEETVDEAIRKFPKAKRPPAQVTGEIPDRLRFLLRIKTPAPTAPPAPPPPDIPPVTTQRAPAAPVGPQIAPPQVPAAPVPGGLTTVSRKRAQEIMKERHVSYPEAKRLAFAEKQAGVVPATTEQFKAEALNNARVLYEQLSQMQKDAVGTILAGGQVSPKELKAMGPEAVTFLVEYMQKQGITWTQLTGRPGAMPAPSAPPAAAFNPEDLLKE